MAAANATAPSRIRNVGAMSSFAIPSCVSAAKAANTMMLYCATLPMRLLPVAPRTMPATKLASRVASTRIRIAAMIWNVGYELGQNVRDRRDPQSVHGHRDGDEEDQPEDQLTQDGERGLLSLGPIEELLYAPALHPALEAHALEDPSDNALEDLGYDEADDEDDDGADERRKCPQDGAKPVR